MSDELVRTNFLVFKQFIIVCINYKTNTINLPIGLYIKKGLTCVFCIHSSQVHGLKVINIVNDYM